MAEQNEGSEGAAGPGQAPRAAANEGALRAPQDRPDDPLFVPHIDALALEGRAEAGDEYAALLESICGVADDSQPVEQYDGTLGVPAEFVAAHQAAVGQVQWNANLASVYTNPGNVSGVRWGSGTMISADLFLTCGHLFDQTGGGWQRPRQNGTTNIITPQEIARNMRVNFNYQVDAAGNLRAEQSFPILELIEYRLGGLDMAVCRVGGNPGAAFGRASLSTTDAAVPDMLCIIGHPAGQPKRIEAGPTTAIDGNLIRYNDIDTLGGNSGSGILRASDGRLVGIHTNGGCNPSGTGSNFGQRIAAVIAASPTLQALVRPKLKFIDDGGTLKFADDGGTLKFSDDGGGTLKFVDDGGGGTLKFRDDGGTLKFSDDGGGTLKFIDDGGTLKFSDDGGGVTLKFRDDVPPKAKVLDDVKAPALDHKGGFDAPPVVRPTEQPAARPFILSTPHHSNAWLGAAQDPAGGLARLEAGLAQIEQAMAAGLAQLAQLDAEYRELLAQYEAARGDAARG